MMDSGLEWLANQTEKHLSSSALYRRGSLSVTLQACKARTTFELNDANGILISIESRDFLITANKLVLDESITLPVLGDQVIETIGDELHSYEVNNFGGEWPYRYCDPYRHKLRIHTKYVGIITSP